jgi:hypothetical protein
MAATYEPIATTTASGSVSTYTFSSIPSTYTDLVLVSNIGVVSSDTLILQVNGDTGSNYSRTYLSSYLSGNSGRNTNETWINLTNQDGPTSNAGAYVQIAHFMNYSNTTTYKTVIGRSSQAGTGVTAAVALWQNTNAINSITVRTVSQNFASGSTFTLYGIKAA